MKPKKISNRIIIGFAAFIVIGLILGVAFQPNQNPEKEYKISSTLPDLLSDPTINQLKITGYNQLMIQKNDTLGLWCTENLQDIDQLIQVKQIDHVAVIIFNPALKTKYRQTGLKLNAKHIPETIMVDKGDLRLDGFSTDSIKFQITNRSYVEVDHIELHHLSVIATDTSQFRSNNSRFSNIKIDVNNSEVDLWGSSNSVNGRLTNHADVWLGKINLDINITVDSTSTLSCNR
jgi:hypothetical protein